MAPRGLIFYTLLKLIPGSIKKNNLIWIQLKPFATKIWLWPSYGPIQGRKRPENMAPGHVMGCDQWSQKYLTSAFWSWTLPIRHLSSPQNQKSVVQNSPLNFVSENYLWYYYYSVLPGKANFTAMQMVIYVRLVSFCLYLTVQIPKGFFCSRLRHVYWVLCVRNIIW